MRGDQDSSAPRPRLAELAVEDLGVIARAVIEPAPGLTAITGETGAGKTMLLAALDLLRGGRADLAVIRSGADRALATGVLSLPSGHPVLDLAAEMAATTDDDELVLTRTVSPSRSRAIAGGCPVPASGLARLTEDLVAVHGQADQRRLTSPAEQRDILDTYAGPAHLAALATYRETFAAASDLRARIERMTHASREDRVRADELSRGLAEIRAAAPRPGEEEQVTAEIDRLTHSEGLTRAVSLTQARLVGAEDAGLGGAGLGGADLSEGAALSHIDAARRSLSNAAQLDPELEQIAERLADLHYQLQDVSGEVGSYLASLEPDPARLESLHERRSVLNSLVRRYGPTLSDVLTWAEEAENALMDLDAGEDAIAERRAELVALEGELAAQAAVVSQGRSEAATKLSTAVEVELAGLAMPEARFAIVQEGRESLGGHGGEDVGFMLTAHPGAPARPLGRGASGGELSRIMLALEVALASAQGAPSAILVFDEVDAGVGGQAAVEVGRRLARLSRSSQVLVVTHLAQVAAFADRQIVVTKAVDDDGAVASVAAVTGEARERELARMLSGHTDTPQARAHAALLLTQARE